MSGFVPWLGKIRLEIGREVNVHFARGVFERFVVANFEQLAQNLAGRVVATHVMAENLLRAANRDPGLCTDDAVEVEVFDAKPLPPGHQRGLVNRAKD